MSPQVKTQEEPHPMVEVPDAIRVVLKRTAKTILEGSAAAAASYDVVSSNAPTTELLGRILADDVLMSLPGYPPYRASIMDGYAIKSQEYCTAASTSSATNSSTSWTHKVSGRVHAGPSSSQTPNQKTASEMEVPSAVYVTTGARIPDLYDCVVPIELIEESSDQGNIRIAASATIETGKWIRDVGCDIPAGSVVLPRGSCIHPVSLGLLQQSGQAQVKLCKPIKVGVLSTGNELLVSTDTWADQNKSSDGNQRILLQTGQIPDVNKPILLSLLSTFGHFCQPIDLGMERDDDMNSMANTLRGALESCDVVLTTGGISMGETDIVEDVLVKRLGGTLHFGRLNMKPGKPTTFVTIKRTKTPEKTCLVFALPGNPVSAFVCTHLVVRPALNMLMQYRTDKIPEHEDSDDVALTVHTMVENTWVQPEIMARLTHDIKLDMERPEYHRVLIETAASSEHDTEYIVSSTGVQRSSRLMSLRDAQGLLVLPRGSTQRPKALAGHKFPVLLLDENHQPVRLKDSQHFQQAKSKPAKPPTRVTITQVSENSSTYPILSKTEISTKVQKALSGSSSGSIMVVSCGEYSGSPDSLIKDFLQNSSSKEADSTDIWVFSCTGSFSYCLEVSQVIRNHVGKVADALALQARRGAAAQEGTAALFEPVVGYIKSENNGEEASRSGCMVIALPQSGVEGGLDNVRGLLKHALNVAQGRPHTHHHKHHGHGHEHKHGHGHEHEHRH